ncbi:RNA-guided endonuclease InsQ/TnpB family protein [Laspinema olomoucense]|uniref:RNA-guided endonuclease InsQ/TnpB family protein n=1 Tax=Laspinema olomoucense TaxID=3231600 RepID=UPI0021BB9DC1|nr:transposase [Laspinema sp. D3d]
MTPLVPGEWSDLENQVLSSYASKQDANSWFSMTVTPLKKGNSLKISCPSSLGYLLGYTGTKPKISPKKPFKKTPRNSTTKTTPNAVKKIRIYPGKELHQLWKQWLAAYRWIYNWTIAYLRKEPNLSAFSLQKLARQSNRPNWVKELPGHQLQEAVADAVDAYKQARANQGTASFKSCRAFSQVIKFKAGNFKNGTWYCQRTKGLSFKSAEEFPQQCLYGTQLLYQKGKWFGCFPEYREPTPTEQEQVIALDPGIRTFLTGYDGETILEIGQNDIGRINRLCTHLDQLMSKIALSPNKRQRYKMRKAATRMRSQIQNLVKDLHNKSASFLVNNYKLIFLPTFETSQMVSRQQRKIRSKTARHMLTWSHYKFAQNLEHKASRNGVMVVRCNESFTSKTCSECGHIHAHLGGNKTFRCPECGYEAPRDWNGGRSVMLRSLQAAAFTIVGDAILFLNLLSHE